MSGTPLKFEEGFFKGNHDRQTMIKSSRAYGEIFFVGKRHIFAGNTLCISRKCNAFPAGNSRQMPKTYLIIVCLRSGVPYANFDYFLSIESNRPPRRRLTKYIMQKYGRLFQKLHFIIIKQHSYFRLPYLLYSQSHRQSSNIHFAHMSQPQYKRNRYPYR